MPTLLAPETLEVVIIMTNHSATNEDKVGIMKTSHFFRVMVHKKQHLCYIWIDNILIHWPYWKGVDILKV